MKAIQINVSKDCEQKVNFTLEELEEISSQFCANELDHRNILAAYRSRLKELNDILESTEYTGLLDLLTIFLEGVEALVESGRELNNDECRFLLKFPNLIADYFSLPLSKLPGKILIRFFKDPDWVRPISDSEEEVIYQQIANHPDVIPPNRKNEENVDFIIDSDLNDTTTEIDVKSEGYGNETSDNIHESESKEEIDVSNNSLDIAITADLNKDVSVINDQEVSNAEQIDKPDSNNVLNFGDVNDNNSNVSGSSPVTMPLAVPYEEEADDTHEDSNNYCELPQDILYNKSDENEDNEFNVSSSQEISLFDVIDDIEEDCTEDAIELKSFIDTKDDEILPNDTKKEDTVSLTDLLTESEPVKYNSSETEPSVAGYTNEESVNSTPEEQPQVDLTDFLSNPEEQHEIDIDKVLDETSEYAEDSFCQDSEISLNESVSEDIPVDYFVQKTNCEIDENQQMLIDIVRSELAEIIDTRDVEINKLKNEKNIKQIKHLLLNYSEQAENISNAVELIGLDGLSRCSHYISNNIGLLSDKAASLQASDIYVLYEWPVKLFAYLQDINNKASINELVDFLKIDAWSIKLSNDDSMSLVQLLSNPVLQQDEKEQRQDIATKDDISLDLPDDVNQELLEGLLQDLPEQTEEFSSAIDRLNQYGSKEDIERAQRVAHTLKGAANVVGVKGIASLTHHLEDILEYLNLKQKQPTKTLLEVLVNSADCLEGMSESLLGIDEAPDNALNVLQSVLDWANTLDTEGLSDESEHAKSNHINPASIVAESSTVAVEDKTLTTDKLESANKTTSGVTDNVLRIPVELADDLLRIAGESLISNTQIETRVKTTLGRQEIMAQQSSILQEISFDLEQLIDIQGITSNFSAVDDHDDFDALEMDKFHELHSVSRRLVEVAADSVELSQSLKSELLDLKNLVIDQDKLQKNNQDLVLRTRMVPVKTIAGRLKRGVRQASRLTHKNVELEFIDNDTYMDSEVLNEMIEPLMHIIRNAVDHGIEPEETRKLLNKNAKGSITVECTQQGDQVAIHVQDDGRGLDALVISGKAQDKGLIEADRELSEEAIYRIILEPGFSTRDEVTQTSGRGIGLDVVNNKLRTLKGSLNISSIKDHGTKFEIYLPISSFSTHSLMVRVRQYIYAISNRGIEEVLYPGSGELKDLGNQVFYQIDDEVYEVKLLDDLLNLGPDRRKINRNDRPVVIVKDDTGQHYAVLVQEVVDSRDVVVKPMGQYIPKIHGTIGATVLGDGSVSPVIDLPELISDKHHISSTLQTSQLTDESVHKQRRGYVLVVDDSLSARKAMSQFTEDMGLATRSARDGVEALSIIESNTPDLILVDMEMPRMNGLELTAHIRANENTRHVPVIMITSRSSDKHRQTAMSKGVNHYMVKPFDEEMLAVNISELLSQKT